MIATYILKPLRRRRAIRTLAAWREGAARFHKLNPNDDRGRGEAAKANAAKCLAALKAERLLTKGARS